MNRSRLPAGIKKIFLIFSLVIIASNAEARYVEYYFEGTLTQAIDSAEGVEHVSVGNALRGIYKGNIAKDILGDPDGSNTSTADNYSISVQTDNGSWLDYGLDYPRVEDYILSEFDINNYYVINHSESGMQWNAYEPSASGAWLSYQERLDVTFRFEGGSRNDYSKEGVRFLYALDIRDPSTGVYIQQVRLQATGTWSGIPPVPIPGAAWLFGSGLLGLVGMARRKKS